ncbi:C39 family peptidase [Pantoea phage Nufs112]|nr:C39 family peptidase [Pantoea phage Nufs112]
MGVYQRLYNDCGVAALGTLLDRSYPEVKEAWIKSLGRDVGFSNFNELIAVANELGFKLSKSRVKQPKCIIRVREHTGDSKSHWVVLDGDNLWCPELGESTIADYPWKHFGHSLYLIKE